VVVVAALVGCLLHTVPLSQILPKVPISELPRRIVFFPPKIEVFFGILKLEKHFLAFRTIRQIFYITKLRGKNTPCPGESLKVKLDFRCGGVKFAL
jgi:hypothetical protein